MFPDDDSHEEEDIPESAIYTPRQLRQLFIADMFASFDKFNERLFTQDAITDLVFYHNNQDLENDKAIQITELLYTYADSACDILNSCTRPAGPVCYMFLRKLHRRAYMIYSKSPPTRTSF